jgi:prepilin-type N-terminal cleavage/methylation domain-containing protein
MRSRSSLSKRFRKRSGGFSLIEVMIAMTFLAIGLMGIAQLVPLGLAGVTQARVRTNAVQAGQEKMDELRAADFNAPALTAGTYAETNGNYTLTWTVTDNVPVPGSKRIELASTWTAPRGTQSVALTTYLTTTQ